MNEIALKGTCWRPTVKAAQSGMLIFECGLSMYDGKDRDGKTKYSNLTVKAFKDTAEAAGNALQEKENIVVVGRLTQETWNDKETGKKQYKTVLIADTIAKDCKQFSKTDAAAAFGGHDVAPDDEIPY